MVDLHCRNHNVALVFSSENGEWQCPYNADIPESHEPCNKLTIPQILEVVSIGFLEFKDGNPSPTRTGN